MATAIVAFTALVLWVVEVSGGVGWPIADQDLERSLASLVVIVWLLWLVRRWR